MKKFKPYIFTFLTLALMVVVFMPHQAHALGFLEALTNPWDAIQQIFASIMFLVLWFIMRLVWMAAILLNLVIYFNLNIKTLVDSISVIKVGWTIFRDISNMFFIFMLLWTAIKMILFGFDGKISTAIKNLVLAALLINFSFFFTGLAIDASNIVAKGFYEAVAPIGLNIKDAGTYDGGIAAAIMSGFGVQTIFDSKEVQAANNDNGNNKSTNWLNTILVTGFGSIFALVAAFTLFAAAVVGMLRIVVLILLLMLSPLGFVGMIVPYTKKYADQWLETLLGECLWFPLYMILLYITLTAITSGNLTQSAGGHSFTFVELFTGDGKNGTPGAVIIFFNFILLTFLMLSSIIVAKKVGAASVSSGMGAAQKWYGQGVGKISQGVGYLGKRSAGAIARSVASNEKVQNLANRTGAAGFVGKAIRGGAKMAGNASYDPRGLGKIPGMGAIGPTAIIKQGGFDVDFGKSRGYKESLLDERKKKLEKEKLEREENAEEKRTKDKKALELHTKEATEARALKEAAHTRGDLAAEALAETKLAEALKKLTEVLSSKNMTSKEIKEQDMDVLKNEDVLRTMSYDSFKSLIDNKDFAFRAEEIAEFKKTREAPVKELSDGVTTNIATINGSTATPAAKATAIEAERKRIKDMLNQMDAKEVSNLSVESLKNPELLNAIKYNDFVKILERDDVDPTQKEELKKEREKPVQDLLATVGTAITGIETGALPFADKERAKALEREKVAQKLDGMSEKEILALSKAVKDNALVWQSISNKQFESIQKNSEVTSADKNQYKANREKPLVDAIAAARSKDEIGTILSHYDTDEIVNMDISTLSNENVARAMDERTLEAINKSKRSASDKDAILAARSKAITDAVAAGKSKAEIAAILSSYKTDEVVNMNISVLSNEKVAEALDEKTFEAISKSKRSESDKDAVLEARFKPLETAATPATLNERGPGGVEEIIGKMNSKQIAKLNNQTKELEAVIKNLSIPDLNAMVEDGGTSSATKAKIRQSIIDAAEGRIPTSSVLHESNIRGPNAAKQKENILKMAIWLKTGPGKDLI